MFLLNLKDNGKESGINITTANYWVFVYGQKNLKNKLTYSFQQTFKKINQRRKSTLISRWR